MHLEAGSWQNLKSRRSQNCFSQMFGYYYWSQYWDNHKDPSLRWQTSQVSPGESGCERFASLCGRLSELTLSCTVVDPPAVLSLFQALAENKLLTRLTRAQSCEKLQRITWQADYWFTCQLELRLRSICQPLHCTHRSNGELWRAQAAFSYSLLRWRRWPAWKSCTCAELNSPRSNWFPSLKLWWGAVFGTCTSARWTSHRWINVRVSKGRVVNGNKKVASFWNILYDQALSRFPFTFWSLDKIYKIFIPGSHQAVQ